MAAPRLGIFALVTFLILLTHTYSHRPFILLFQKVNKILWQKNPVTCFYKISAVVCNCMHQS